MTKSLNVEIFKNNTFLQWFPATSIKDVLSFIARYEKIERMSDIKLSYLVFQQSNNGRYKGLSGRYTKVCSIHATGNEKPKFFDLIQ